MNPLSKSKAKYIKSLQLKKQRLAEARFIVEGEKSVLEFIRSNYIVEEVIGTELFFNEHSLILNCECTVAKEAELGKLGSFKSNNSALAVVRFPESGESIINPEEIVLALDGINDPGNLGTIIRIADWFGINTLVLNETSVDEYNPKVVSASKGSLTRVKIIRSSIKQILTNYSGLVYAADMEGEDISKIEPINAGVIIMGNESHGISNEVDEIITQRITIPRLGGAESLNVAVATGIVCSHLCK